MQDPSYTEWFGPDRSIPARCSAEEFTTDARRRLRDAQPSFKALGLATGFVGQGADLLIIDDPYASPQDAMSEVVRESTWAFWDESARVRLTEQTNVVVMFHRYHGDDLAGRLFEREGVIEEGGAWEVLRYAAQEDGEKYCMPPDRDGGAYLSTRFSQEWYKSQEARGLIWFAQFQGRPSAKEGLFFQPDKIGVVDEPSSDVNAMRVRAWDFAATAGAGDWTVGVLQSHTKGTTLIEDVRRGQYSPEMVEFNVINCAQNDPPGTLIRIPQDPGAAGKHMAIAMKNRLHQLGYRVKYEPISGAKESRAYDFACAVNGGIVNMVRAPWNSKFREELRSFPLGANDDQVDAASDGYNEYAKRGRISVVRSGRS